MDRYLPQTLKISSTPQTITTVLHYIEGISKSYSLTPDKHFDVVTCITEAVNNAIVHGNACDCSKSVHLSVLQKKDILAIHVSDEGSGFDYENLPDPTSPDHLENIGGRGVYLIKQLSDRVSFLNNGSTVEMEFRL